MCQQLLGLRDVRHSGHTLVIVHAHNHRSVFMVHASTSKSAIHTTQAETGQTPRQADAPADAVGLDRSRKQDGAQRWDASDTLHAWRRAGHLVLLITIIVIIVNITSIVYYYLLLVLLSLLLLLLLQLLLVLFTITYYYHYYYYYYYYYYCCCCLPPGSQAPLA